MSINSIAIIISMQLRFNVQHEPGTLTALPMSWSVTIYCSYHNDKIGNLNLIQFYFEKKLIQI